jgi:hypothetical protein
MDYLLLEHQNVLVVFELLVRVVRLGESQSEVNGRVESVRGGE